MEKIKNNKQLCVGLALIILDFIFIVIVIILIRKMNKPHDVVLPALERAYAEGMVKENECYIVRFTNPDVSGGISGWYYMDGREKKKIYLRKKSTL